ncbi:MAG TPA: hypothetical protein VGM92_09755, partial [Candidatus Kapabacteria bacterium]
VGMFMHSIGLFFGNFDQKGFDQQWYDIAVKPFGDANTLMSFLEHTPEWLKVLEQKKKRGT